MRQVLLLLSLAACTGDVAGDDVGGPITVDFTAPGAAASFTRDQLGATGQLTAAVATDLAITGEPSRVAISIGGVEVAEVVAGHATVPVPTVGSVTLVATAYDAAGAAAATDEVEISIVDPVVTDCQGWLALYQVEYTPGPANPGVDDPVTATMPINGMPFRYIDNPAPRATMFADCELILSLARAAAILRERGITEVADIGIYNYRCIGGGTPPDCPSGISQHAYAKAIDLAGFTYAAGEYASVNDDWVIDPAGTATCDAEADPGKDAFLHELICALKDAGVWNIVLTPNYNSDHRNHFHVDLTTDADFIRGRGWIDHPGTDGH